MGECVDCAWPFRSRVETIGARFSRRDANRGSAATVWGASARSLVGGKSHMLGSARLIVVPLAMLAISLAIATPAPASSLHRNGGSWLEPRVVGTLQRLVYVSDYSSDYVAIFNPRTGHQIGRIGGPTSHRTCSSTARATCGLRTPAAETSKSSRRVRSHQARRSSIRASLRATFPFVPTGPHTSRTATVRFRLCEREYQSNRDIAGRCGQRFSDL